MGKGESSISDEEWERFLRESEAGATRAPEEPSARARMVTRRLREQSGQPQGWRTHQPVKKRKGKAWYVLGLLVVAALIVVAVAPERVTGWFGGDNGGGNTPLAAETARPDQPPPTQAADQLPTLREPFRGSPAVRWADGTAGIDVPAARATGWMTKKQVAQALDRSRDFLAASSLDPAVLDGERPAKAIALLNPHQRDVRDYVKAAFVAPTRENDPLLLFSRFSQAKVELVGNVVKTRGRITYREGKRGAVEVTTDVTYVYPVTRAEPGSEEVVRTIARREVVMSWDDPAKVVTEPGTFSLISYKLDSTNGGCDAVAGYFVPQFRAERTAAGDGPEVDPYDRSTSMEERMRHADDDKCGTASRE